MPKYWLDTNFFITLKNQAYGFDIAPGFWQFIDNEIEKGSIGSSSLVCQELIDKTDDELAAWVRERKDGGLFIEPDAPTQQFFSNVANHVSTTYSKPDSCRCLPLGRRRLADCPCGSSGGTVVTFEVRVPANSQKVKIPNVCGKFGVACYGTVRSVARPWLAALARFP